MVVLVILGVAINFVLSTEKNFAYGFSSGFIIAGTTAIQLIVFLPKVSHIYHYRISLNSNKKSHISGFHFTGTIFILVSCVQVYNVFRKLDQVSPNDTTFTGAQASGSFSYQKTTDSTHLKPAVNAISGKNNSQAKVGAGMPPVDS